MAVLRKFRDDYDLPADILAERLQVPVTTVRRWVYGHSYPTVRSLPQLCRLLGWDATPFTWPEDLFVASYEDKFLSLNGLADRFADYANTLGVRALSLVPVAGALVYAQLCETGLGCRLQVVNFDAEIVFLSPLLEGSCLMIRGNLDERKLSLALLATMPSGLRTLQTEWRLLSPESLEELSVRLKKILKNE